MRPTLTKHVESEWTLPYNLKLPNSKDATDATPALESFPATEDHCSILFLCHLRLPANLDQHNNATNILDQLAYCREQTAQARATTRFSGSAFFRPTFQDAKIGDQGMHDANRGKTLPRSVSKDHSAPLATSPEATFIFATVFFTARACRKASVRLVQN